jgi:hypothetical protein
VSQGAPPRELSVSKTEIIHPNTLDGRGIWLAPEVQGFLDRLQNGDSTIGWEGDPRLALYRTQDRRWEIWRQEHDGEPRLVCRSRPGLALDNRLIMRLMEHDTRRGFRIKEHVDKVNAKVDADKAAALQPQKEAAADKLMWALRKDVGHLYG